MHADCVFSDFSGWAVVRMERGAAASFVNCELANNTAVPSAGGAAVIVQDVWSAADTATTAVGSNVRLEGCAPRGFNYHRTCPIEVPY